MTRLPRLLDPGSLPALALTILAAVSCGGRVDSGGGEGGGRTQPSASSSSSSSPNVPDAGAADSAVGTTNAGDAGLACTDPIHMSIGETVSGSTCGGTSPAPYTICSQTGPVAFFYVDAPSGAAFRIDATPSAVTLAGYTDCAHGVECSGPSLIKPDPSLRLLSVQLLDSNGNGTCGNFTITVANQ
jgi:hypothetical protein